MCLLIVDINTAYTSAQGVHINQNRLHDWLNLFLHHYRLLLFTNETDFRALTDLGGRLGRASRSLAFGFGRRWQRRRGRGRRPVESALFFGLATRFWYVNASRRTHLRRRRLLLDRQVRVLCFESDAFDEHQLQWFFA